MKASSAEWKKNVYEDNRKFVYKTDITLADGTVLHVDNSQIMQNGVSFSGATSESGVFSIGSMVSSKVTVRLNNMYDDFSAYDFTNATAYVYVGMLLSETIEWLKMGQFNVESPTTRTAIISLEMLDNLSKTDKVYVPKVTFPCTRLQLAQDACSQSGLYLNTTNFYGWNQSVAAFDITSTITCRQILSYIAQVGCLYGMCDENGYLNFKWYNTTSLDSFRTNMDGGNFTDYTSGTTVDGGDFTDYSIGDVLDGGSFIDMDEVAFVYSIKSQEINTDDVVITGVKITYQYSDDETKELKVGTDGYVIGISENPLINKDNVQAIANYIYSIIGGLTFRPLTVGALADPRVEAGDIGVVIDRKQNVYPCIFTTLSVTYGGYETYTCDAESAARNSAAMYSAATQAIVTARENAKKQITAYDQAVQRLTNLMTNCFGVFKTEEVQDDGSVVYYMHNKPALADSMTIWKMTADGFAVSTDGGTNYDAGFDAQGNAVFNVLNAIGINANWINVGDLTVGGKAGDASNIDGKIRVLDAKGNLILDASKEKFTVTTPKFKIDDQGNVFLNTPYVQKSIFMNIDDIMTNTSNYKEVIGQTMVHGVYYPNMNDIWYFNTLYGRELVFDLGDAYGTSISGNGITVKPLAGKGIYSALTANGIETNGTLTLGESTDSFGWNVASWSGDGNVNMQGGKFVTLYGSFKLKKDLENDGYTEEITRAIPTSYRPKLATVRTIVSRGGRTMVFYINLSGDIRVRNLSNSVIPASTSDIQFRLDYFRF